ncbi:hypothetical protein ACQPWW_09685 [Micromonospora sp. CA-240977]
MSGAPGVAAHRRPADQIIERGDHEELMVLDGRYAALARRQTPRLA